MKEFLPFRLDTVNQCLWRRRDTREDERILLTPKAFSVLRYLVEHAGRLVSQDELLEAVWPDTFVQPEVLKYQIADIRNVLGDQAKNPLFIETLPRRGYQFIAAVTEVERSQPPLVNQTQTRVVGRERELVVLGDSLRRIWKGQRQIVFITGEPGIGKTALVDEFLREAAVEGPSFRIARGQCVEGYGGAEAYYPMLEALGELCKGSNRNRVIEILAAQAPTWLVQFPGMLTQEHRQRLQQEILGATRGRMLREIGEALDILSAEAPLVLVLEDLQWVDPSTVDFISALARQRTTAKTMLIITKRPLDMVVPDHPLKKLKQDLLVRRLCQEIALGPLSEADLGEYLRASCPGSALPEGLAELLFRQSDGNPLFINAILHHMTENGLISCENGGWQLRVPIAEIDVGVPATLQRMIEAQLEHLTAEEQRALEVASVVGASFSSNAVAAVMEMEVDFTESLFMRLSRGSYVVRGADSQRLTDGAVSQVFEFVHALYSEVLYRRIAPARKVKLHAGTGQWAEAHFEDVNEIASWLADQFEHAADWPRAVKYLRLAAEGARRRYANREAAFVLQRALTLSTKLPRADRSLREIEILELLGMIYAGDYDARAIECFEAMASLAAQSGLVDVEMRALIGLIYPLSWSSSRRCFEVIERALALSDRQNDLQRAVSRINCHFFRIWVGGWNDQDCRECRNALDRIQKSGDLITRSYHLAQYSLLQWASSEYREADRNLSDAVSNVLRSDDATHLNLGLVYWVYELFSSSSLLLLGEWGKAFGQFRAGVAVLEKNGDEYRAKTLRLYLAWAHLHVMDFETVLSICESSFPHPETSALSAVPDRASPLPEEARICLILRGSAHLGLGNFDRAREDLLLARQAMDRQMVILDWYWRMPLELALADVWLGAGDVSNARTQAQRLLEAVLLTSERTWQALAWEVNARVALAESDLPSAESCIVNARSAMNGFEVPLASWRVDATAARFYERLGNKELAEDYRQRSQYTIQKLADSLESEESLRTIFLSAAAV